MPHGVGGDGLRIRCYFRMGKLKKAASGVLALLPNLRAHRLAALRGVRAHVLRVRSARQKGCGLAGGPFGKTQGMLF